MRFVLIFLFLFSTLLIPAHISAQTSPQKQALYTPEELSDPKFQESLSFTVVKFVDRKKDVLKAEFRSRHSFKPYEFKLFQDRSAVFAVAGKDEVFSISQEEFLKKYKDKVWIVQYRQIGPDKFIYHALRTENLFSLKGAFAQDPNDNYQNIELVEFWEALRAGFVVALTFDEKTNQLGWGIGRERGVFELSPYCVFAGVKKQVGNNIKTTEVQLSINHLIASLTKPVGSSLRNWMIFYSEYNPYHQADKGEPLKLVLRAVTMVEDDMDVPKK